MSNVTEDLYKVGTVITNPQYEGQGWLSQLVDVILKKYQGKELYLKSCSQVLICKFEQKGFIKYTRDQLLSGSEEMKQFLTVVELEENGGITSSNKYILTNKAFNYS